VPDKLKVEAKRLSTLLHSLQVNNELVHHENQKLKDAVTTKQKHKKKSAPLDLQQPNKFRSKATFWGPEEIVAARKRKVEKEHKEEEKLQKSNNKQLAEAERLYEKQQKERR
jgi:hypothetical protein